MVKYIGIDSGKEETKYAAWDGVSDTIIAGSIQTSTENGLFSDDDFPGGTFITKIDGRVVKIGESASGRAPLSTSKMQQIHRDCMLSVIASLASENEVDEFHVAIGAPITEYQNVSNRLNYKYFCLTEDKGQTMKDALKEAEKNGTMIEEPDPQNFEIDIRTSSKSPIVKKKFKIVSMHVYPEGGGIIYMDTKKYIGTDAAVIDIGSSTMQGILFENLNVSSNTKFFCNENGGNMFISGLTQRLSTKFGRVNDVLVRKKLRESPDRRYLTPNKGSENKIKQVETESKELFDTYIREYITNIKRNCDANGWSTDFMDIIFTGGTAYSIRHELKEVFGENVTIERGIRFANAVGFLKRLCAKEIKKIPPHIELPQIEDDVAKKGVSKSSSTSMEEKEDTKQKQKSA